MPDLPSVLRGAAAALPVVTLVAACGGGDAGGGVSSTPAGAPASAAEPVAQEPVAEEPVAEEPPGEPIDPAAAAELERAAAAQSEAALRAPRFTRTYRHPAGVYFLYPERWRLQEIEDGVLALVPDDARTVGGEPVELYAVVGEDAGGVARPDEPEVLRAADRIVRSALPFLRRDGDARILELGGERVAALRWRGTQSGLELRAEMQVALLGRYAVGAFVVAPEERFEARQRTLSDFVRTFGFEEPESDPRLVGRWRHTKTYISGSFSTITVRDLVLRADGACFEGGRLMAGMEHADDAGEVTGATHADSGRADYRGRWRSEGSRIVLEWEGAGTETWEVYVSGADMLWKSGGEKKLWERRD